MRRASGRARAGSIRLGAVDYLNARPLVYGIDRRPQADAPDFSIRFDLPTICADLLDSGQIDLGLIPTIAYFDRPGFRVVPGIGIVSSGAVASVALFTRRPIEHATSIALDTSSRTSAALTRVLFARVFGSHPVFVPHAPDLATMLDAHDAALLIGDPALFAEAASVGAEKVDLGQTWTDWTGLPFVWAFWAGPEGAVDAPAVARLQAVKDEGVAASDAIADAYCPGDPARQAIARRYLRENIQYDLSEAALAGLRRFYTEAAELGLIGRAGPALFY